MFDVIGLRKEKAKKEPYLVWISGEDYGTAGAHVITIADNCNWAKTTTISIDGLQPLSDNPQAQMDIMDVRFQRR